MVHLTRAAGLMEGGRERHVKEILQNTGMHENCIMVKEKLFRYSCFGFVCVVLLRGARSHTSYFTSTVANKFPNCLSKVNIPAAFICLVVTFAHQMLVYTQKNAISVAFFQSTKPLLIQKRK